MTFNPTPEQKAKLQQELSRNGAPIITVTEPVDLGATLNAVESYIRRFVHLTAWQLVALTLWVAHTHAFEASRRTPYIIVTSPREECGKSLLLEVLALLVRLAWSMEGPPSEASLFRKIEKDEPTVLFDESESIFGRSDRFEGMRAIILGGNRRGATVPRCVGPNHELRDFCIYAPKAFAAIKATTWPRTQLSRSIVIKMQRIRSDEKVEDFYSDLEEEGDAKRLQDSLAVWAEGAVGGLRGKRPERIESLGPRAFEGWVPLLNIADEAGGEWPERARKAAEALSSRASVARDGETDLSLDLLADIRKAFKDENVDRLWTGPLLKRLNELEEASWGSWNDGDGMKPKELSNKLKPYEIYPKAIRDGEKTRRGYLLKHFEDVFSRYLPPEDDGADDEDLPGDDVPSETPATTAQSSQEPGVSQAQHGGDVALSEGAENPHSNADVADVADRSTEPAEEGSEELRRLDIDQLDRTPGGGK